MKRIDEILKEDSKVSAMRWALVWVVWMSLVLILCTGAYIVITAIKGEIIAWTGIAILILALTGFVGAAVTGKYFQKKEELK